MELSFLASKWIRCLALTASDRDPRGGGGGTTERIIGDACEVSIGTSVPSTSGSGLLLFPYSRTLSLVWDAWRQVSGRNEVGSGDSFIMRSDIPATGSFRPKLAGEASDRLGREGLGRSEFAKAVHSNGPTKFVFVRPCPAAWTPKSTMYLVHQLAPPSAKSFQIEVQVSPSPQTIVSVVTG